MMGLWRWMVWQWQIWRGRRASPGLLAALMAVKQEEAEARLRRLEAELTVYRRQQAANGSDDAD